MTTYGSSVENAKALEEISRAMKNEKNRLLGEIGKYATECANIEDKINRLEAAKNELISLGDLLNTKKNETNNKGIELEQDSGWTGLGKNIARLNYYYITKDWDSMEFGRICAIARIDEEIGNLRDGYSFIDSLVGKMTNSVMDIEKALNR